MAPAVPRITGNANDGPGMIQSTNPTDNNNTVNGDGQHRPRNERAMENFRQFVMKIAEISGTNTSPAKMELIERRFADFFSNYHIPNHPPYAAMIQRAIQELNEKGGSSEESISDFIRKEYDDLPWAHNTFLNHHLQTLSESGDIIMTRKCCYLIGGGKQKKENAEEKQRSRSGRGRSRGRVRKNVETVENDIQTNVVEYDEVIEGYKPYHEERDEMTENVNEPEKEEGMLVEEVNRVLQVPSEVMKEQNDVILDLLGQVNPVMDDYHVPLQLQDSEVSLSATTKEPEHLMVEQIFEVENPCNGLSRHESEQENSSIQVQNEVSLQLGGQYIPPESELTLQTTLINCSNLDSLDKEENPKLPNSETDSSDGQKTEIPKPKKAEAPVRRFTRSLLTAKQATGEHVEDSSGAPMEESTKIELTMTNPQNPCIQEEPTQRGLPHVGEQTMTDPQDSCLLGEPVPCRHGRGRPRMRKPDTPVGELTTADPQTPFMQVEPARRGRPPKQKTDTPLGELRMADPQNPFMPGEPARRGRPPKQKPDTPVGELRMADPQNPFMQGEPARRGRPPKRKPDTPVGELTMADTQNPCMQGKPARRGRPPKQKLNTPVGEVLEQPHCDAHSCPE